MDEDQKEQLVGVLLFVIGQGMQTAGMVLAGDLITNAQGQAARLKKDSEAAAHKAMAAQATDAQVVRPQPTSKGGLT